MSHVVVLLADGFEECEGLLVVDLLRRANVQVTMASIMGKKEIVSSHQITLLADALVEDVDFTDVDMVVLPGGLPGTFHLRDHATVQALCKDFAQNKKIAAICAAPSVFAGLGLLEGKEATCHPSFEEKLVEGHAIVTKASVTKTGNIITGQGLGAGISFALELVKEMVDEETAKKIAAAISYQW